MIVAPLIPDEIVNEIRAHAERLRNKKREIVGRAIIRNGVVVQYQPLVNVSKKTFSFSINRRDWDAPHDGDSIMMVHSHPGSSVWLEPSNNDMNGAHETWLEKPYAIFFCRADKLGVFSLRKDRAEYDTLAWAS